MNVRTWNRGLYPQPGVAHWRAQRLGPGQAIGVRLGGHAVQQSTAAGAIGIDDQCSFILGTAQMNHAPLPNGSARRAVLLLHARGKRQRLPKRVRRIDEQGALASHFERNTYDAARCRRDAPGGL